MILLTFILGIVPLIPVAAGLGAAGASGAIIAAWPQIRQGFQDLGDYISDQWRHSATRNIFLPWLDATYQNMVGPTPQQSQIVLTPEQLARPIQQITPEQLALMEAVQNGDTYYTQDRTPIIRQDWNGIPVYVNAYDWRNTVGGKAVGSLQRGIGNLVRKLSGEKESSNSSETKPNDQAKTKEGIEENVVDKGVQNPQINPQDDPNKNKKSKKGKEWWQWETKANNPEASSFGRQFRNYGLRVPGYAMAINHAPSYAKLVGMAFGTDIPVNWALSDYLPEEYRFSLFSNTQNTNPQNISEQIGEKPDSIPPLIVITPPVETISSGSSSDQIIEEQLNWSDYKKKIQQEQ